MRQNEDMKETDQRACTLWVAQWRERILPDDATALPHSRPRAGRVQGQGQFKALADIWRTKRQVDTWKTRFGGAAKVGTRPDTQG